MLSNEADVDDMWEFLVLLAVGVFVSFRDGWLVFELFGVGFSDVDSLKKDKSLKSIFNVLYNL